MIAKVEGTLEDRGDNFLIIATPGVSYQVQVPQVVAKALETLPTGSPLALETIYYLQVEQTRATPVLIGFQNSIQREFFERLITVPKMGPKAALNAFARPVSTLATAIETANYTVLQGLPGIGKQKAREIVAALQGKVAKFALMQDSDLEKRLGPKPPSPDVSEEALQLMIMLGHKRAEAERIVNEAMNAEPETPDAESLVRVIYRMQREKK